MTWQRRILVVEDEPLVASLLCEVLEQAGFRTRSASNAADARDIADDFDPDAALIDINLGPGPNGIQLGQVLHQVMPGVALVFLTKYFDPHIANGGHGAVPPGSAFLSKDRIGDVRVLVESIESALLPGSIPTHDDLSAGRSIAALPTAQIETLRLVALGLTNAAIAQRRGTSERAVERRLRAAYEALGIIASPDVNPRVEAVKRYVAEAGLPVDDSPELAGSNPLSMTRTATATAVE